MGTNPNGSERRGGFAAWLDRAPVVVLTLYAMVASFMTYFCMYAFRKPFTVARFEDLSFGPFEHVDLKTAIVISQILGYTLSKYIGIKICSEITWARRAGALILLILWAEAALVLFGLLPNDWKVLAIFLNGLPLGMIWGLVVAYLEGRRTSELLLAALSCSFIVSSGVVKDVGKLVMDTWGASESWMPAATGALFLPLFLLSVWLLSQLPRPTEADVAARVKREPMNGRERLDFVRRFAPGLLLLFLAYVLITAFRDFRDIYGIEILGELGYGEVPAIFSLTELPIAFGVMVSMALLNLIRDNRMGLLGAFVVMTAGVVLIGVGSLALDAEWISGVTWMILVGLGAYLCYVPYNSVLFDRLIASTGVVGTAVFCIYLADALGYTGSITVQLYKDLGQGAATRLGFFHAFTYVMAIAGVACLVLACLYFVLWHSRRAEPTPVTASREGA